MHDSHQGVVIWKFNIEQVSITNLQFLLAIAQVTTCISTSRNRSSLGNSWIDNSDACFKRIFTILLQKS